MLIDVLKPVHKSKSVFVMEILEDWAKIKALGSTNFYQSVQMWSADIDKMNDEQWKRFDEHFNAISVLYKIKSKGRILNATT